MTDDQACALRLSWDRFLIRWAVFLSLLTRQFCRVLHSSYPSEIKGTWRCDKRPAGQGRRIWTHTETQKDPQELSTSPHHHCFPWPSEVSHCLLPGAREEGKRLVNNYTCQGIKSNQQAEINRTMVSNYRLHSASKAVMNIPHSQQPFSLRGLSWLVFSLVFLLHISGRS